MSQMTKEQLVDRIRQALSYELRSFLEQMTSEEQAYQAQIANATAQAEAAPFPEIAKAWKEKAKDLQANKPDLSAGRRQEAALALKVVANEFRLPLELRPSATETTKSAKGAGKGVQAAKESGKRMKRSDMQKLLAAVIAALPADGAWARISELAEKAGASTGDVRSALLRLKREGQAQSNGRKGLAGAWKRK